jgi:hypothetical protein
VALGVILPVAPEAGQVAFCGRLQVGVHGVST